MTLTEMLRMFPSSSWLTAARAVAASPKADNQVCHLIVDWAEGQRGQGGAVSEENLGLQRTVGRQEKKKKKDCW